MNMNSSMRRSWLLCGTGAAVVALAIPGAARAQGAAAAQDPQKTSPTAQGASADTAATAATTKPADGQPQPGDIIVTAQRRSQLALKTPLSLTALDNSLIEKKQISGLSDLQFAAPGIRSGQQQGVNRIFIRGIGLSSFASGADSSVAFYVDGVYIGRPTEQLSSFYDISRIEVLRGPQGALYGRNATGGAVNLISSAPDRELGGYVNLTAGNYSLHQAEGAINAPLTADGDLRARVAFKLVDRGGYGYDFGAHHDVNDAHSQSARGTLQYNPNNDVDVRLIGEYTREKDNNNYATNFGAYPGYTLQGVSDFGGFQIAGTQNAATAVPSPANQRTGWAVALNAKFSLTDRLSINSITGWREFDRLNIASSDGTSVGLGLSFYHEKNHQISQEIVLNYDAGALNLTGGVSYYHEHIFNDVKVPFIQYGSLLYDQNGVLDIDAVAGYAQGTYSITPHLRLTAAGRYSTEKRSTVGTFTFGTVTPIDDARRWSAFTPKFGVEYDIARGTLVYASATKGFKSGTFNIGQDNPAIDPETIWAYEAGIKSRLLNNKIDITAAVFHYDYSNLQVNKIIGLQTLTTNAAAAKDTGIEISVQARPTKQLTLDANFTYLDATFSRFNSANGLYPAGATDPGYAIYLATHPGGGVNFSGSEQVLNGNPLPGSPKYSATVGAQYVMTVGSNYTFTLNADGEYQSRVYFNEFKDYVLSQKGVGKANASIKFDTGKNWSLTLWGKNIFNAVVASNKTLGIALWGYPIYGAIEPPATFGGTLGVKF